MPLSKECFKLEFAGIRHGQNSRYVHININFQNETFIDVNVDLLQSYVNPTWEIQATRWNLGRVSTKIFNTSIRVCEIERLSTRNLYMKAIRESVLKVTNFKLTCPIASGQYFMRIGTKIFRTIFPLRLFYEKNTFLSIYCRFYEQVPMGNYTLLAEYFVNTVIKRYC